MTGSLTFKSHVISLSLIRSTQVQTTIIIIKTAYDHLCALCLGPLSFTTESTTGKSNLKVKCVRMLRTTQVHTRLQRRDFQLIQMVHDVKKKSFFAEIAANQRPCFPVMKSL